jgi:hypothetical protein
MSANDELFSFSMSASSISVGEKELSETLPILLIWAAILMPFD